MQATAPSAIHGIDISAILVRDARAETAFYRDVLGIAPTAVDDQGRGAEFTLADGTTFGVWQPDEGPNSGGKMTFFSVGDADAAVAAIRARGGTIGDAFASPVCRMAHGADPDGNAFAIHERTVVNDAPPPRAGEDDADIVGLDVGGVFAGDTLRAIAFYRDVLGLTPTLFSNDGKEAEFALADGATFGVWTLDWTTEPQAGPAGLFAVRDLAAAVRRIRARGVHVTEPQETPVCFIASGADPEGHTFMLHQRKAPT